MSLDIPAGTKARAHLAFQYLSVELMPIVGGRFSVAMQATLLDEQELQFVGEDLAHVQVATIEEALSVIRENTAILSAAAQP